MGAMRVEYSTQYNKPGAQEGTQQSFILGGSAPAFSLRFSFTTNKAPYASLSIFFSKTGFIWDVSLNRTEEAKVTDHDSQSTGTKLLYSRDINILEKIT